MVRALPSHGRGHRFESCIAHVHVHCAIFSEIISAYPCVGCVKNYRKGVTLSLLWIFFVCAVLIVWTLMLYRDVKRYKAQVDNAWQQLSALLEQRSRVVTGFKDIAGQPLNGLVEKLENALAPCVTAAETGEFVARRQCEEELSYAIDSFLRAASADPGLRSDGAFLSAKNSLAESVARIRLANLFYNDQVLIYNTRAGIMPRRMIARLAGFKKAGVFDIHLGEFAGEK